ncbi:hypothetical protein CR513_17288, partial [Mucuna pruriens]
MAQLRLPRQPSDIEATSAPARRHITLGAINKAHCKGRLGNPLLRRGLRAHECLNSFETHSYCIHFFALVFLRYGGVRCCIGVSLDRGNAGLRLGSRSLSEGTDWDFQHTLVNLILNAQAIGALLAFQSPMFSAFQSNTEIIPLCSICLHSTETKSNDLCRERLGHCRGESQPMGYIFKEDILELLKELMHTYKKDIIRRSMTSNQFGNGWRELFVMETENGRTKGFGPRLRYPTENFEKEVTHASVTNKFSFEYKEHFLSTLVLSKKPYSYQASMMLMVLIVDPRVHSIGNQSFQSSSSGWIQLSFLIKEFGFLFKLRVRVEWKKAREHTREKAMKE